MCDALLINNCLKKVEIVSALAANASTTNKMSALREALESLGFQQIDPVIIEELHQGGELDGRHSVAF